MAGLYHAAVVFLIVLTILTFASSFWITNPYGRFASAARCFTLPGKISWLMFECPQWWAFTVTFWLVAHRHGAPAVVLYALRQAHYLYRGLIFR